MDNNEIITKELELRKELAGEAGLETYKKNYLIEAGAGAGKTYTMVNRIINQLDKTGIEPEKIAAITFTEKATQEMLGRIVDELYKRLEDAKKAGNAKQAKKLRTLLDNVDQMQVSTIHSFCSKLLKTMPFYSPLGPDFENVEDDELATFMENFFNENIREDNNIFEEAIAVTGITYEDLKYNFANLCEVSAEIICKDLSLPEVRTEIDKTVAGFNDLAEIIWNRFVDEAGLQNVKNISSKTVQAILPQINKVAEMVEKRKKDEFVAAFKASINPMVQYKNITLDAFVRVLPGNLKDNNAAFAGMESDFRQLAFDVCMYPLKQLVIKYREEKCRQGKASSNDLLYFAKEMLHKHKEAREYFHNRYATIYVDEMQ
ncbi:MAG: UvrD-helicase domain-containing protein, partial [Lachnospiraceae bacterium]|nr:UvrD-helicase domain-containing protein [Lachnospiraceae bacterium]